MSNDWTNRKSVVVAASVAVVVGVFQGLVSLQSKGEALDQVASPGLDDMQPVRATASTMATAERVASTVGRDTTESIADISNELGTTRAAGTERPRVTQSETPAPQAPASPAVEDSLPAQSIAEPPENDRAAALVDPSQAPCRALYEVSFGIEDWPGGWADWSTNMELVADWGTPVEVRFRYPSGTTTGTVAVFRSGTDCELGQSAAFLVSPGDTRTVSSEVGELFVVRDREGTYDLYHFVAGDEWSSLTEWDEFVVPRPQIEWNAGDIEQCYEYDCDFRD